MEEKPEKISPAEARLSGSFAVRSAVRTVQRFGLPNRLGPTGCVLERLTGLPVAADSRLVNLNKVLGVLARPSIRTPLYNTWLPVHTRCPGTAWCLWKLTVC